MRRLDRALKLLESREDRVWGKGIPTGARSGRGLFLLSKYFSSFLHQNGEFRVF